MICSILKYNSFAKAERRIMEVYWATTSMKFADYQREQLKSQANAVPRKVRKLSMALLFCFILIYVAVLGQVLLTSMGTLF